MHLKELKDINKTAYVTLIEFWSHLSRIDFNAAKADLSLDMNMRYFLERSGDTFILTDTHADQEFEYDLDEKDWKFI